MAARLALVGEAWGADEEAEFQKTGRPFPFVGSSGQLLNAMLLSAGIERAGCLVTNVINLRPPGNDFAALLVKKEAGIPGWPALQKGKYFPPALLPELQRLHGELADWQPEVIVALGSKALWALCRAIGMSNRHGFVHFWSGWVLEGSPPPIPVIPTWHPASVQRAYSQFLPAVNDLRKARMLAEGSWKAESFRYKASPTLEDLQGFLADLQATPPPGLAVDIETKPEFRSITHIGFSTTAFGICCPLWDPARPGQSYWPTPEDEAAALDICARLCSLPVPKITQNGAYDIAWLRTCLGIEIAGPVLDIRLAHFALFPELPHNLAEMASTWLMMPPWKAMHRGNKDGDGGSGSVESE